MVTTTKSQITYVVFAHPDDEYASWALIHKSTANYPVFCMLTRGEQSGHCPAPNYQAGEKQHPSLLPAPKGTTECATARINSFRDFHGAMASIDSTLEDPVLNPQRQGPRTGVSGFGTISDRNYLLYAGSKCAFLFFNLGDGSLTTDEVNWAIASARAARSAGDLPNKPEYAVIAASYYWEGTANSNGSRLYPHVDHKTVNQAIYNKINGYWSGGRRWGATAFNDSRASRTDSITASHHEYAFVRSPSASSIGAFQKYYGWLEGYWEFGRWIKESPNRVYQQKHWQKLD
ncbi:hypothetical protein [Euzebya sp.]|uniref:hypothetical protein n=1 Tax=Euzebya sp. TaxID=1971409 RepID=UPI003514807C